MNRTDNNVTTKRKLMTFTNLRMEIPLSCFICISFHLIDETVLLYGPLESFSFHILCTNYIEFYYNVNIFTHHLYFFEENF